jgi:ectoine hydroxylase-related dioxygenase (phytanoyl-CoA dioxygenase family)
MLEEQIKYAHMLDANGFAHIAGLLDTQCVRMLSEAIDGLGQSQSGPGIRDLAAKSSVVREIASSSNVMAVICAALDSRAKLVRSILFMKTVESNWGVSWHQDLSIAVRSRQDVPGYSGWSEKDGIAHVQPPELVLERMVALRIHLDSTDESNGALLVSPGSHKMGRIPAGEAAVAARKLGSQTCIAAVGDVILMRPLTLHASYKSKSKKPRRIIHLEYAGVELAAPLQWNEAA